MYLITLSHLLIYFVDCKFATTPTLQDVLQCCALLSPRGCRCRPGVPLVGRQSTQPMIDAVSPSLNQTADLTYGDLILVARLNSILRLLSEFDYDSAAASRSAQNNCENCRTFFRLHLMVPRSRHLLCRQQHVSEFDLTNKPFRRLTIDGLLCAQHLQRCRQPEPPGDA